MSNEERAVTYSRVSSDEEVQLNALVNQVKEAKMAVENKGWLLVDEYIDEGKSGTTTKRRDEYNRLVNDLESNKFDIIVVKSQDRLMRNTREWYVFVDKLVQNGKKLFFYLENKFYSTDDALITGIKAILAEEYSRDLSKKINNAHRHRQQSGSNISLTSKTWGYDKVDKKVVVNEEEAHAIRLMYEMSCQGYGCRAISKELENRGYKNRNGGHFYEMSIRRILRNPLYKGTVVMNKRHIDFDTKKTIDMPEEDWIIHEGLIPAIVDEELWERANYCLDQRSKEVKNDRNKRKGVNTGKHELSSKIICGDCGATYWRRRRKDKNGNQTVYWSCSEYIKRGRITNDTNRGLSKQSDIKSDGGCDNIHLKETDLTEVLYKIAKDVFVERKDDIVNTAMKILERVINEDGTEELKELKNKQESIMNKREILLDKSLDGIISDDLFKRKDASLESEYNTITEKITSIERSITQKDQKIKRLAILKQEVINIADKDLTVQKLYEHIDKITVHKDYAIIDFDIFDSMKICIEQINYRKKSLSVCYHS